MYIQSKVFKSYDKPTWILQLYSNISVSIHILFIEILFLKSILSSDCE